VAARPPPDAVGGHPDMFTPEGASLDLRRGPGRLDQISGPLTFDPFDCCPKSPSANSADTPPFRRQDAPAVRGPKPPDYCLPASRAGAGTSLRQIAELAPPQPTARPSRALAARRAAL